MAEILQIQCKTLYNQSINLKFQRFKTRNANCCKVEKSLTYTSNKKTLLLNTNTNQIRLDVYYHYRYEYQTRNDFWWLIARLLLTPARGHRFSGFILRTTTIQSIFTNGTGDLIRPVWTHDVLKLDIEVVFIARIPPLWPCSVTISHWIIKRCANCVILFFQKTCYRFFSANICAFEQWSLMLYSTMFVW